MPIVFGNNLLDYGNMTSDSLVETECVRKLRLRNLNR
jgi:hypothetical protein